MHVNDIIAMVTELSAEHRMYLLKYLRQDSDQLPRDVSSFSAFAGDFPRISFYETIMSQPLVRAEADDIDLNHKSIDLP